MSSSVMEEKDRFRAGDGKDGGERLDCLSRMVDGPGMGADEGHVRDLVGASWFSLLKSGGGLGSRDKE